MRKLCLLLVVAGWSALFACESAQAQSIVGRWRNLGNAMAGARYVTTVLFYPNGTFQYQMAIGGGPPGSSGIFRCAGQYRFDGQSLVTRGRCANGTPLQLGGFVQILNQYQINIAGDNYRRF